MGKFWETIVFSMIGETLDESDEICGARILYKVGVGSDVLALSMPSNKTISYRLEIWFKTWTDKELKQRLEKKVLSICNDYKFEKVPISFEQHVNKW